MGDKGSVCWVMGGDLGVIYTYWLCFGRCLNGVFWFGVLLECLGLHRTDFRLGRSNATGECTGGGRVDFGDNAFYRVCHEKLGGRFVFEARMIGHSRHRRVEGVSVESDRLKRHSYLLVSTKRCHLGPFVDSPISLLFCTCVVILLQQRSIIHS